MTARLLARQQLRRIDAYSTGTVGTLADHTRADLNRDGSVFPASPANLPRFSLGSGRPAAGIEFAVAALASGAGSIAADGTATVRVYGASPVAGQAVNRARTQARDEERAMLLGSIAATFGTKTEDVWVGRDAENGGSDVRVRWADILVWTASAYGTALLDTAYGAAAAAYSPGGNLVGKMIMPQLPTLSAVLLDADAAAAAVLYIDARLVA